MVCAALTNQEESQETWQENESSWPSQRLVDTPTRTQLDEWQHWLWHGQLGRLSNCQNKQTRQPCWKTGVIKFSTSAVARPSNHQDECNKGCLMLNLGYCLVIVTQQEMTKQPTRKWTNHKVSVSGSLTRHIFCLAILCIKKTMARSFKEDLRGNGTPSLGHIREAVRPITLCQISTNMFYLFWFNGNAPVGNYVKINRQDH